MKPILSARSHRATALLLAGTALVVSTSTAPASAATPTAQSPAEILQAGLNQGVADAYPGVIAMIRDGNTVNYLHAGTGDVPTGVPADPNAQFRIGSNTKAFIATVLLQLEAEGKLSLDDTVAKWLPNAIDANAYGYDGSKITIRELLNHTSELPDYYDGDTDIQLQYLWGDPTQAWSPQTLVNVALGLRAPDAAPGTMMEYANTNYVLAGMVIQAVTGNDPATEITNRIITPLSLTNTSFPTSDPHLYGNYLHGYMYGGLFNTLYDKTVSDVQVFGAAGAMVSTLEDLSAFSRALLTGALLPPAQQAELETTVPSSELGAYGLGLIHASLNCPDGSKPQVWGHTGSVLGYFSYWISSDDGSKQILFAADEDHGTSGTNGQSTLENAAATALCTL